MKAPILALAVLPLLATTCDGYDGPGDRSAAPERTPRQERSTCAIEAPSRVSHRRFVPPSETRDGVTRARLTFLDGSRVSVGYPRTLRLLKDGVQLYTTGGTRGRQVRPQITFGGVHFKVKGRPVRCLTTPRGEAGVWAHPDGDVLILRFGSWFVSVSDDHTNIEVWARHLRGRVTDDGWLVLRGDRRLLVGPEQRYGDTNIMLGNLEPGVILWPLRCRDDENFPAEVAKGRGIDGPQGREAFASWCDRSASMQVHVYAGADFIAEVAEGLRIDDVRRAHPLDRYHIVP